MRKKYNEIRPILRTKCDYCMPCPNGVDIPRNIDLYNYAVAYNDMGKARWMYNNSDFPKEQRASACAGCRTCEEKCPQKISEWMKIDDELGHR